MMLLSSSYFFRMKEGSLRKTKITLFLWSLAAGHLCLFTLAGMSITLNGPFYLAMTAATLRLVDEVRGRV